MLYKESSNSNGQQFQQYQQNGKKPSHIKALQIINTTTYNMEIKILIQIGTTMWQGKTRCKCYDFFNIRILCYTFT